MPKSEIRMDEVVKNTERKFGEALEYYPVKIVNENGHETWAMFTENEIINATERAMKNKEDIPKSIWENIFG